MTTDLHTAARSVVAAYYGDPGERATMDEAMARLRDAASTSPPEQAGALTSEMCERAAKADFEFPPTPPGIVAHEKLGDLFDRFALHQYGLRVAEALLASAASTFAAPSTSPAAAAVAGEPVAARIAELEAELNGMAAALQEARQAPWPEWAVQIMKTVREYSGYDGYDDASEGVDLPEEVRECLEEFSSQIERLGKAAPHPSPSAAEQAGRWMSTAERLAALRKLWQRFKSRLVVWWHESDEDMIG